MIYVISNQQLTVGEGITVESDCSHVIEYFRDKESIGCDTETTALLPFDGKLLTIQLGDSENQWVVDCSTIDVLLLKELLESKVLLFHNAKFDLKWLKHAGINAKKVYCSYVVELILTAGYEPEKGTLGLKDICKKYLNVEMTKDDRGLIHKEGLTDRVIEYCRRDVLFLHQLRDAQMKLINQHSLQEVEKLENKFVVVLSLMEYNGVHIDKEHWRSVTKLALENLVSLKIELDATLIAEPKLKKFIPECTQMNLFGFEERVLDINWNSATQKLAILKELGLKISSVEDKEIRKYQTKHKLVALILDYNKNQKLASTYGEEFLKNINKNTGRLHTEFKQMLRTSRISSSKPNLLNIPRKGELGSTIRRAFVAREGYKYVGGDYSGMELRIMAEISQEPLWIDCFNRGGDLHSELCTRTFNIPLDDIHKQYPANKDVTYRETQKLISFALIYGSSEFTLSNRLSISIMEAKKILTSFFAVVPKVKSTLEMLKASGVTFGRIRTPLPYKRLRWFPDHKKLSTLSPDDWEFKSIVGSIGRESCNTPIQGANGDVTKDALNMLQDYIDDNNYPAEIKFSVYDEIQCEVRADLAEEFKLVLESTMIAAAKKVIKSIPVVVDLKIADYWKK